MQDRDVRPVGKCLRGLKRVKLVGWLNNPQPRPTVGFPALNLQPRRGRFRGKGPRRGGRHYKKPSNSFHSDAMILPQQRGSRKNCMSILIQYPTSVVFTICALLFLTLTT